MCFYKALYTSTGNRCWGANNPLITSGRWNLSARQKIACIQTVVPQTRVDNWQQQFRFGFQNHCQSTRSIRKVTASKRGAKTVHLEKTGRSHWSYKDVALPWCYWVQFGSAGASGYMYGLPTVHPHSWGASTRCPESLTWELKHFPAYWRPFMDCQESNAMGFGYFWNKHWFSCHWLQGSRSRKKSGQNSVFSASHLKNWCGSPAAWRKQANSGSRVWARRPCSQQSQF